jgi:hypothetical protein
VEERNSERGDSGGGRCFLKGATMWSSGGRLARATWWRRKGGPGPDRQVALLHAVGAGQGSHGWRGQLDLISNEIQILSNFDRSKEVLLRLEKIEIKYGCEGF